MNDEKKYTSSDRRVESHRAIIMDDKRGQGSLSPMNRNTSGEVNENVPLGKVSTPSTRKHIIAPIFALSSSHRLSTSLLSKNLSNLGLNSPANQPKRTSIMQQTTEPRPTQTTAD